MSHFGVLEDFPGVSLRLLYTRRAQAGMNKRGLTRMVLNENQTLTRMARAFADLEIAPIDFGKLSLREQMEAARRSRILLGMHGEWMRWMRRGRRWCAHVTAHVTCLRRG